ncbi:hypothetical protein PC116_g29881 [Phytophthora cactorum]|nr:hypothetical protein PC116_g29881 [Phytophthora cactorum]
MGATSSIFVPASCIGESSPGPSSKERLTPPFSFVPPAVPLTTLIEDALTLTGVDCLFADGVWKKLDAGRFCEDDKVLLGWVAEGIWDEDEVVEVSIRKV